MDDFLLNIPHPDADLTQEINLNVLTRTMNSCDWEYGKTQLERNPNQDRACIYWCSYNTETQWLMRGPNGLVRRIIKDNQIVYQAPYTND